MRLFVLLGALVAGGCAAEKVPAVAPARLTPPHVERRSYGKQTALADSASALTLVAPPVGVFAFPAGFIFGAPIVHLAHKRPGIAAASFGLRLVPFAVFAGVGAATDSSLFGSCNGEGLCAVRGLLYGASAALATALAVSVFDALVLANEKVAVSGKPLGQRVRPVVQWDPRSGSGQLGVGASF